MRRQFGIALNALSLHPYDPHENESVFEIQPGPCWCGPCSETRFQEHGIDGLESENEFSPQEETVQSPSLACEAAPGNQPFTNDTQNGHVPGLEVHDMDNDGASTNVSDKKSAGRSDPETGMGDWPRLMVLGHGTWVADNDDWC